MDLYILHIDKNQKCQQYEMCVILIMTNANGWDASSASAKCDRACFMSEKSRLQFGN
jgi:hypothetical protein